MYSFEQTQGAHTVPRTLKNIMSISSPSSIVFAAYTPSGKVNPHQPILKGNGELYRTVARANTSQIKPKLHMRRDMRTPKTYVIWPAIGSRNRESCSNTRATLPIYRILGSSSVLVKQSGL
jgi:hypothetical protein